VPTTPRSLRIADDVWRAALERARSDGTTLTDVVETYLRRYAGVKKAPRPDGRPAANRARRTAGKD
jgi:hypothetical protein